MTTCSTNGRLCSHSEPCALLCPYTATMDRVPSSLSSGSTTPTMVAALAQSVAVSPLDRFQTAR